ncbi:MAG: hypothetical protein IKL90_01325 [Alphaproteobacteria bacterium]|nr:hypothetical protein [Alphaproteobacteria bacterium]
MSYYSRTALRELKKRYLNILKKCFLANLMAFSFILSIESSATANILVPSENLNNIENDLSSSDGSKILSDTKIDLAGKNLIYKNLDTTANTAVFQVRDGAKLHFQNSDTTTNPLLLFSNNTLTPTSYTNYMYGSTVTNFSSSVLFDVDVMFKDNLSIHDGASGNNFGGAIYNSGTIQFNKDASFIGNMAKSGQYMSAYGGAIYNDKDIIFNGSAVFKGNTALSSPRYNHQYYYAGGGAIYNTDQITFNKDFLFAENVVQTVLDENKSGVDILNVYDATINFSHGTEENRPLVGSLDGGIDNRGIINKNNSGTLILGDNMLNEGDGSFNQTAGLTVAKSDNFTLAEQNIFTGGILETHGSNIPFSASFTGADENNMMIWKHYSAGGTTDLSGVKMNEYSKAYFDVYTDDIKQNYIKNYVAENSINTLFTMDSVAEETRTNYLVHSDIAKEGAEVVFKNGDVSFGGGTITYSGVYNLDTSNTITTVNQFTDNITFSNLNAMNLPLSIEYADVIDTQLTDVIFDLKSIMPSKNIVSENIVSYQALMGGATFLESKTFEMDGYYKGLYLSVEKGGQEVNVQGSISYTDANTLKEFIETEGNLVFDLKKNGTLIDGVYGYRDDNSYQYESLAPGFKKIIGATADPRENLLFGASISFDQKSMSLELKNIGLNTSYIAVLKNTTSLPQMANFHLDNVIFTNSYQASSALSNMANLNLTGSFSVVGSHWGSYNAFGGALFNGGNIVFDADVSIIDNSIYCDIFDLGGGLFTHTGTTTFKKSFIFSDNQSMSIGAGDDIYNRVGTLHFDLEEGSVGTLDAGIFNDGGIILKSGKGTLILGDNMDNGYFENPTSQLNFFHDDDPDYDRLNYTSQFSLTDGVIVTNPQSLNFAKTHELKGGDLRVHSDSLADLRVTVSEGGLLTYLTNNPNEQEVSLTNDIIMKGGSLTFGAYTSKIKQDEVDMASRKIYVYENATNKNIKNAKYVDYDVTEKLLTTDTLEKARYSLTKDVALQDEDGIDSISFKDSELKFGLSSYNGHYKTDETVTFNLLNDTVDALNFENLTSSNSVLNMDYGDTINSTTKSTFNLNTLNLDLMQDDSGYQALFGEATFGEDEYILTDFAGSKVVLQADKGGQHIYVLYPDSELNNLGTTVRYKGNAIFDMKNSGEKIGDIYHYQVDAKDENPTMPITGEIGEVAHSLKFIKGATTNAEESIIHVNGYYLFQMNETSGTLTVQDLTIDNATVVGILGENNKAIFDNVVVKNTKGIAFENSGGTLSFENETVFKNNQSAYLIDNYVVVSADENGNLITKGDIVFNGKTQFLNNEGENGYDLVEGGVIYNESKLTFEEDAIFKNNKLSTQDQIYGAIYNYGGPLTDDQGNPLFDKNGNVLVSNELNFDGNTVFQENLLSADMGIFGGIIKNEGGNINLGKDVLVDKNIASSQIVSGLIENASLLGYNDIIYNSDGSISMNGIMNFDGKATFSNNELYGTDSSSGLITNIEGTINFKDTTVFKNNLIQSFNNEWSGKVLENIGYFYKDANNNIIRVGDITFDKEAYFVENKVKTMAPGVSGALYNEGNIVFKDNAYFVSNEVESNAFSVAGAVYNFGYTEFDSVGTSVIIGDLIFEKDVLFQGNKASTPFVVGTSAVGGAMINSVVDTTFKGNAVFKQNSVYGDMVNGGALVNTTADVVNMSSPPKLDNMGNIIFAKITFEKDTLFENNEAIGLTLGAGGALMSLSAIQNLKKMCYLKIIKQLAKMAELWVVRLS